MNLINELYIIEKKICHERCVSYIIRLCSESIIYKAHFPNYPVTPGVCVTQIAVELVENLLNRELTLTGIKNLKFLSVLSPDTTPEVTYELSKVIEEGDIVRFQCVVRNSDIIFSKMSVICKKRQ